MSDQDNQSGTNTPESKEADPIGNVKAEVARKLDALRDDFTQSNQQLAAQIQALMQNIEGRQTAGKSTTSQERKLSELIYEDPDGFANTIQERVTSSIEKSINQRDSIKDTVSRLESEYPELRDRNSEAYKRVQAHFSALPDSMKRTSEGLEIAALRAVQEQGLVPSSKRKAAQNEDFALSGQSGSQKPRKPAKEDGEMTAEQAAMAELMNVPMNDPKFKAEFAKATKRTYGKYR